MSKPKRDLTREDEEEVFRIATRGLIRRYSALISEGMTDEALAEALANVLGIFGGCSGPDSLSVTYKGSGLKIWGSWEIENTYETKPLFQGSATIAMARYLYQIEDPDDDQMALF